MKNLALLICLISVSATTLVTAQAEAQAPAQSAASIYSPKSGYGSRHTVSQLTTELNLTGSILDGQSTQNLDGQRNGIGAGVRLDIGRTEFVFETGLQYRQMGGITYLYTEELAREKGITDRLEADLELNYLSVPLMAKYYFNGRSNPSFYSRIGLQPSFLLFKEARLRNSKATSVIDYSHISEFELTGAAGVGFQIPINDTTLAVFEGTYLRGLTSVFDNTALYNNGFSGTFGLGILL